MKIVLLAFAVTALSFTPALAQDFTPEQRAACSGDYEKFCKGTLPGGGRVIACLDKNRPQLTAACGKVVDSQKK
jgi:hypothetical protein